MTGLANFDFLVLGPILVHQTTKFELSGQFRFSRHPCGPWGCQSRGVKPKLANPVTVQIFMAYPENLNFIAQQIVLFLVDLFL